MAAILDFQVAGRMDFISMPIGIPVPNLVPVSQFARFFSYPLHCYAISRFFILLVRQHIRNKLLIAF